MSENEEKLRRIFAEVLQLPETDVTDDTAYDKTKNWDSVAHMALIAALDSNFDTMLDTDDVLDMSTYRKAREILTRYGVHF